MKVSVKKIGVFSLCLIMLLSLCACDKKEWIFSLNGEELYEKDVAAFGYIYTMEYNIKDEEQLDELYSDTTTYGEYYKEQLEDDILSTVLLCKVAEENGVKLSDEAKSQIETHTARVLERFGKDALEETGVSESDIEQVYKMKMLGEAYLDALTDEESDVEEENPKEEVNPRYIKVYQVTFPTVQMDEDGMVQSDTEGNLKKLSPMEISERKQQATEFAEKAQLGEDMETLLKDCETIVSGIEKYLKYSDLEPAYQAAIDGMSDGEVSGVIESDYGFYVIRLLAADDTEYASVVEYHEKESAVLSAKEELLNELYTEYGSANKEYKNADKWNTIEMKDFLR